MGERENRRERREGTRQVQRKEAGRWGVTERREKGKRDELKIK